MENIIFQNIKNKKEFKKWLLRIYFTDSSKAWFHENIDETNVLEYISTIKNFPQTPNSLTNLWKLKEGLKKFSDTKEKSDEEKEMKYCVGDETLKVIGKEIGDVTPTMVTKLHASAINKIRFATHGTSLEEMDSFELDNINVKIFSARNEAVKDYITILQKHKSGADVVADLVANKFMTKNEMDLITPEEILQITNLGLKDPEEISTILHRDIEIDNNIFKTFQSVVSKKFYKNRKFI